MGVIASALGLFYLTAAFLALRRARHEAFPAATAGTREDTAEPDADRSRLLFVAASALLFGAAGVALLLKSAIAVWLLGGGLLFQAVYYGSFWLRLSQAYAEDGERWRQAWSAAIISTAAFAFAAYAARLGVLT